VLLGEHHDSADDHALQLDVIRGLAAQSAKDGKPLAVGLEMVQKRFQPVLDRYVQGDLDERGLFEGAEWARRWTWPFELYEPLFRFCRSGGVKLVALNTDAEVLAKVESGGLERLSAEDWQANMPDRTGFRQLGQDPAFKAYLHHLVVPSYRLHERLGILRQTVTGQVLTEDMSLLHFVGGRLLWDETMAGSAVRALRQLGGPGRARMALLVGNDHVKFRYGVLERVRRLAGMPGMGAGSATKPWRILGAVLNPRASDGLLQSDGTPWQELALRMPVPAAPDTDPQEVPLADLVLVSPGTFA